MARFYANLRYTNPEREEEVRRLAAQMLSAAEASGATAAVIIEAIEVTRTCAHRSVETAIAAAIFGEACARAIEQEPVLFGAPPSGWVNLSKADHPR